MVALGLGAGAGAPPLTAQQDASTLQDSLMREAVRLATEGRTDSAKVLIRFQLDALSPLNPAYAQLLFTAGLVSDTAEAAARYFRQVSIEYSSSAWADRSLLRLAQLAFADGDLRDSRRYTNRVLIDYPTSPVRGAAAFWAGRAEFDLNNPASGCRYMAQAQREARNNIELENQAAFHLQRCATVLGISPQDSAEADSAAAGAGGPADPNQTIYAVQVAAVTTAAGADAAMQALRAQGYTARVFRDQDGLLKVRIGRFTSRRDADALARELRNRLGGQPFVVEENQ
jgi:hypothetical protein